MSDDQKRAKNRMTINGTGRDEMDIKFRSIYDRRGGSGHSGTYSQFASRIPDYNVATDYIESISTAPRPPQGPQHRQGTDNRSASLHRTLNNQRYMEEKHMQSRRLSQVENRCPSTGHRDSRDDQVMELLYKERSRIVDAIKRKQSEKQ